MLTVEQSFQEHRLAAKRAFEFTAEDGLLNVAIKWLFCSDFWRFWQNFNVPLILKLQRRWQFSGDARQVGVYLRRAVDWHILLMTVGLVVAYFVTFYVGGLKQTALRNALFGITLLFTVWRLGEILSVFVELHLKTGTGSESPARDVLNTIWHYLEVIIAFATFYVVVSWCGNDSFTSGTGSLVQSPVTPLYYSVVTIATIGYGDFSPQRAIGKFLVCLEIMLGFILVVIVFQRAISESLSASRDDDGPPSN
jgi:hypothetical protein